MGLFVSRANHWQLETSLGAVVVVRRSRLSIRLVVSIAAAVALVAGLIAPGIAPAAVAASTPKYPALVESPAVISAPSTVPKGKFVAKADLPIPEPMVNVAKPSADQTFDDASKKVTGQDEYSTTYTDKNGLHYRQVSESAINVKVDGAWVPSSTSLSDDGNGGLTLDANVLAPRFAANADSPNLFSAHRDGHSVTFSLKGAAHSGLQHPTIPLTSIGADQASYDSVLPDTDLHYQVLAGSVKESIFLNKAPAAGKSTYVWRVKAPGLSATKDGFNDLVFADSAGTTVFTMPRPTMWDSSGEDGVRKAALTNVDYEVSKVGEGVWDVTLNPDRAWLTDPDRVYPVVLDPTVDPLSDNVHSYKSDGATFSGKAYVGNTRESGTNRYWRAIQHYNYEQIFGEQLTGISLNTAATTAAAGCAAGGVYNTNPAALGYNDVGSQLGNLTICGTGGSSGSTGDGGIVQQYASWINCGCSGGYIMITGAEGSTYTFKSFNSDLGLYYKDFPAVTGVTGPTPVNGAKGPDMPIMQATGYDPAGTGLAYQYEYSTTSNFAAITYNSGWVGAGLYQVPQGKLAPGTTYYYRISTRDGYNGYYGVSTVRTATNAAWYFVSNTPAPTPPQAQATPGDGEVVTTLTPTFTAPTVTDVDGNTVQYQFRIATGADGKSGNIVTSGWLPAPTSGPVTWTAPVGTLQDGATYSYSVMTSDGIDAYYDPAWVDRIKVNLRVGSSGPSPTDSAGPASVNLANGNLSLNFASPTVTSVGGPMGLSFAYNSLQAPGQFKGLTGAYYNALTPGQTSTTSFDFTGKAPVLVRTDPQISFDWGTGSPAPAVPTDYFMAPLERVHNRPGRGNIHVRYLP